MLVLSRREEEFVVGTISVDQLRALLAKAEQTNEPVLLEIHLLKVLGNKAKFGLKFPEEIHLLRNEKVGKAA